MSQGLSELKLTIGQWTRDIVPFTDIKFACLDPGKVQQLRASDSCRAVHTSDKVRPNEHEEVLQLHAMGHITGRALTSLLPMILTRLSDMLAKQPPGFNQGGVLQRG